MTSRENVFDLESMSRANEIAARLIRHAEASSVEVSRIVSSGKAKAVSAAQQTFCQRLLEKWTLRLLLLKGLDVKGWLTFQESEQYLSGVFRDWESSPGSYSFQQLLSSLFTHGFSQNSKEARRLIAPRLGLAPYLGHALVSGELIEREFKCGAGYWLIPDTFWRGLIGEGGILTSLIAGGISEVSDVMGAFSARVAGHESPVELEWESFCQAQSHLGDLDALCGQLSLEELDTGRLPLKLFDANCGCGSFFVYALRLIRDELSKSLDGVANNEVLRVVVSKMFHGVEEDEFCVESARFRLALELIAGAEKPSPLPDLSRVIEQGASMKIVSRTSNTPMQGSENGKLEFKSTLEWDVRNGRKSPELLFGNLKTICAFLNSEGGTLLIGVDDSGNPIGIEADFALIKDSAKEDTFEGRLREFFKNHIEPIPLQLVSVSFPVMSGHLVCKIVVEPRPRGVTYLVYRDPKTGQPQEEIFVRDGNRTLSLKGRKRDQFILSRLDRS